MRINDLNLRTKILLGSALVLLPMLAMAFLISQGIAASQERERNVEQTNAVINGIDNLLLQLVNMETGYRGFLITGDDIFLEPYTEGRAAYTQNLAALRSFAGGDAEQLARLDAIEREAQTWRDTIAEPGIVLRRTVNDGVTQLNQVDQYERSRTGKQYFDRIREQIGLFRADESALLEERSRESAQAAQRLQLVLGGGTLLAAALAVVIASLVAKGVSRRLESVVRAADALADGTGEQILDLPEGRDEVGSLARAFQSMALKIRQQIGDLRVQTELADRARATAEQARAQLAEQLGTIEEQRNVIREMSVPVLPLSETMRLVPLIGALDSSRLQAVQEQSLDALAGSGVRYLLLDITGVPVVDTAVAQGLLGIVGAARLLGSDVILVGIRPEVAQAIVGLGIELDGIITQPSLQAGISYVLGARGWRLEAWSQKPDSL
ncbi:MAG TPA: CHASE3 domain-containing protein [Roseiflexaceae bacterium]|nr:CHASE3 domain-containing protein [Roseiflexaceae bacterium]